MSIFASISGNTLAGASANGGEDLYINERFHVTTRLPGYGGANNDNSAVGTFLTTTNSNTLTNGNILIKNNVSAGGGGYVGGAACP